MCCMTPSPAPGAGVGHETDHGGGEDKASVEGRRTDSLLDVLRRRYAEGEISRDQLDEMKRVLELSDDRAVEAGGSAWATPHHG